LAFRRLKTYTHLPSTEYDYFLRASHGVNLRPTSPASSKKVKADRQGVHFCSFYLPTISASRRSPEGSDFRWPYLLSPLTLSCLDAILMLVQAVGGPVARPNISLKALADAGPKPA
jgi:hypothetical protein